MHRSPNRFHERTCFFKYMPADTAQRVAANRTLRWSSPTRFNDPFDTPREFAHGISPCDLSRAVGQRLASLIEATEVDTSTLAPKARLIVELARQPMPRVVKAEIVGAIRSSEATSQPLAAIDDLRHLWRTFVADFRILCLTEDPASASMWNHYAGGLTGAVLELACVDELDSAWLAARPVTYDTPAADMFSAHELAEIMLMPQRRACEAILDRGTFRKSPEWSNEREWRIVSSKRPNDTEDVSDIPFHPRELSALYLGPRISARDRDSLLTSARMLPHVRVIQLEIGAGQGFVFRQIDP